MTKDDMVGVYRQVGEDAVASDGTIKTLEPRSSQIMYSPDGYMAVVSTIAGRKRVSGSDNSMNLDGATPDERAEAAKGMVSYAGRFELQGDRVLHHVEMALNPNMIGQTIVRRVHFNGDDLTLSSVPAPDGSYRRIRWRRAQAM